MDFGLIPVIITILIFPVEEREAVVIVDIIDRFPLLEILIDEEMKGSFPSVVGYIYIGPSLDEHL